MRRFKATDATVHPADGPWGRPRGGGSGGGSGGPGPGGGWQSGGGRGREPDNDLEEWLRDVKNALRSWFGGGSNRGIMVALGAFLILWLASGIYQLQPGEQGVVLRFGKFDRITAPGLRYHLPSPFESVSVVNSDAVRMETLGGDINSPPHGGSTGTDEDELLMLTGDENIINLSFNVQWKVNNPEDFAFNLPNPQETVRAVAESAMREIIGRTTLEAALTAGKSKVQDDTRALTQATLDNYKAGIQVLQVNLLDAGFPQAVVDAARDVQAALADRERARNEAEAYRNDILPRAQGKAERIKQEAEAYKQEVVARAEGDTARFLAIYEQYKRAENVTRQRMYLETMEKILTGMNKVILDGKSGVLPYLPLPEVKTGAADAAIKEAP